MKADLRLSRNRSLQHLPQRGNNGVEFCVITALHFGDFSPQVFVSCEHGAELDELTCTGRSLRRTLESIATPCSVNA
ncbi:MAG: hypothetical protein WCE52_21165 [Candidatus Acidiferrum sp.]